MSESIFPQPARWTRLYPVLAALLAASIGAGLTLAYAQSHLTLLRAQLDAQVGAAAQGSTRELSAYLYGLGRELDAALYDRLHLEAAPTERRRALSGIAPEILAFGTVDPDGEVRTLSGSPLSADCRIALMQLMGDRTGPRALIHEGPSGVHVDVVSREMTGPGGAMMRGWVRIGSTALERILLNGAGPGYELVLLGSGGRILLPAETTIDERPDIRWISAAPLLLESNWRVAARLDPASFAHITDSVWLKAWLAVLVVVLLSAAIGWLWWRQVAVEGRRPSSLSRIATAVGRSTGEDFFQILADTLTRSLGVRYAIVAERVQAGVGGEESLRPLAVVDAKRPGPVDFDYPLAGSPCEEVMRRGHCVVARDLPARFPQDAAACRLDAQSLLAVRLTGMDGRPLGLLAVLDDRPMKDAAHRLAIVEILANRAGSELERLSVQRALALSEAKYRQLVETSRDLIWSLDAQGRWTFVNQAAESILGCTSEALIGQPFVDAAPKELRELYGQVLGRVLGGESLHDYEMVCHHSAGARRVLRIKARPRLDADGQIVGIMGTAADVTYLLQAQREIRSNSELFASILSRLPLFFFRVDGEGRFTDIRGAGLRRLHLGEQGLYGRSVYELFPTKERRVKAALGGSTTLFEAHGDHEGEGWSFTVSMFFDNARGSGAVGLAMDVTERKVAETKLVGLVRENRALARRLIEVQEDERTALSRELHDELGQSITAVKSLATAIARVKPGQEQRVPELGNSIVELAAHLYEVVKHIMHRLRPDIIDSMGIEEALRSCVQNSRLEMMGVGVSLELDGDLTGLSELVQVTIYRIVQECLTNIAKYAMASNVAVTVRRAQLPVRERRGLLRGFSGGETSQSMTVPMFRDTLVIDISDDGVGMDLRATLDEPSPASAGLGLQGIRERVTALGGEFEVYSETGRGLQLTVTIDLETHEAKLARDAEASGDAIPPKEVRIR